MPEFAIYNFDGKWQVGSTDYLETPPVDFSKFDYEKKVLIKTKSNANGKETTYGCKVMLFGGNVTFWLLTIAVV